MATISRHDTHPEMNRPNYILRWWRLGTGGRQSQDGGGYPETPPPRPEMPPSRDSGQDGGIPRHLSYPESTLTISRCGGDVPRCCRPQLSWEGYVSRRSHSVSRDGRGISRCQHPISRRRPLRTSSEGSISRCQHLSRDHIIFSCPQRVTSRDAAKYLETLPSGDTPR